MNLLSKETLTLERYMQIQSHSLECASIAEMCDQKLSLQTPQGLPH